MAGADHSGPEQQNLAGSHRSMSHVVTAVLSLDLQQFDPRGETPVFAAGLEWTRQTGGPITQAFLDALPDDWKKEHLVIDSTLVWLGAGFRQGEMFWCHEPFPGRTDGVPAASNCERNAEHVALCCGPAGIDFLTGDNVQLEWSDLPLAMNQIRERHGRLQAGIFSGHLTATHVPPYTLHRYGWGAFHRHSVATVGGFQFWIRATRGDNRPLVNGIRNATNL